MQRILAHVQIIGLFVVAASAQAGSQAEGNSYAHTVASRMSRYEALISEADSLYEAEMYITSAERFTSAFETIRNPAIHDLFNAACSGDREERVLSDRGERAALRDRV